ncbi:MAG: ABC transporter substrate-binding protein [Methylobacteriaceae bacterium]|nr:ABC transporter substrate-binding protein [Methylobacteriaceae bacterium]MBV9245096.1 ABC transporter substrate-binding protein [Methylobacteriaceae bacterium]MBV9701899.1 ABC transporter substrate-binding protein [Methylobacteriaceae bacterium]
MRELDFLKQQHLRGRISRREFLGRAAALGASAALLSAMVSDIEAYAAETPAKGGTLRLGLGGGSTTDSFEPASWTDSVMIDVGFAIFNALVENGPDNKPVPELAESFEAKPGAVEWIFNLRKGVHFHNGKEFDADDAIYSLNLHRGDKTKSGAAGPMKPVKDITKLGPNQIQVTLASADADFPYVLTDYHVMMVPKDYADWGKPIGTGAFTSESFEPGVRVILKKNPNFWKADRGHLDAAQFTVINDATARINALVSGQVDTINRVDPKLVGLLQKAKGVEIVRAPGGWFPIISMMVDKTPFDNLELRTALKYALDRTQVLKTLFSGYGSLGNDHPIPKGDPYFNTQLPQTPHDPEKAAFHFKKAGLSSYSILCQASDAAFNGAVDMATLFQASAAKAGIKVDVKKEPADGFWDNVWLKAPCATSYWGGRPAATQMFSVAFQADAPWNETHWKNPKFEKLLGDAKAELDEAKRKDYIWALQAQLAQEGGALIPLFRDWLDGNSTKVGGHTPHSGFDMDNGRIAEKAWLKA